MSVTYFCDRNLGKKFPQKLLGLGLSVVLHDDLFPPDTPDEVWLPRVSAQGWVVLTLDTRLRYTGVEKETIIKYHAQVILFTQPKNRGKDWLLALAEEFSQAQPKVNRFLEKNPPPLVARFKLNPHKKGAKRYSMEKLRL